MPYKAAAASPPVLATGYCHLSPAEWSGYTRRGKRTHALSAADQRLRDAALGFVHDPASKGMDLPRARGVDAGTMAPVRVTTRAVEGIDPAAAEEGSHG